MWCFWSKFFILSLCDTSCTDWNLLICLYFIQVKCKEFIPKMNVFFTFNLLHFLPFMFDQNNKFCLIDLNGNLRTLLLFKYQKCITKIINAFFLLLTVCK
jgi:hypothetical protein